MLVPLHRPTRSHRSTAAVLLALAALLSPAPTRGQEGPVPADELALVSTMRLGGSGDEIASDLASHPEGGVAIVGGTTSADFPLFQPADATYGGELQPTGHPEGDAFVARLGANGALAFSTYLGGQRLERATGVAVDRSGAVYVAGYTESEDFPVTDGSLQTTFGGGRDAFVAKFDASGEVAFATYLGGSGFDQAEALALDSEGTIYVAGWTDTTDFLSRPHRFGPGGNVDVFVARLGSDGSRLDATNVIGGTGGDGALDLAVSPTGEVVVVGSTASADFPVERPIQGVNAGQSDAFVTRIAADGASILYSTHLGGRRSGAAQGRDWATSVALDAEGSAYVGGIAGSRDFPTTPGAYRRRFPDLGMHSIIAFAAKLSEQGELVYSTFVGVAELPVEPRTVAVDVDATGALYVAGGVLPRTPREFPITRDAAQRRGHGWIEAFLLKLSPDARSVRYSTYLGGKEEDKATAVAVDEGGGVTLVGTTASKRFPGIEREIRKDPGVSVFVARFEAPG